MKAKCSFILKALTALVLAVLMLFGTVSTSLAAVVEDAGTGAKADLAETGLDGPAYLYVKCAPSNMTWWNNDGCGRLYLFGGTSNAYGPYDGTVVTLNSVQYKRFEIPSGNYTKFILTRSYNNNDWNEQTGNMDLSTTQNAVTDFGASWTSPTWGTAQYTSTASLGASKTNMTTTETSTLTPSLSSNTTYNEIKSTTYSVTTNPGSAGSVTSAGVFSATAAGTYTVTATVTYNAKGFSGITKTANATKSITVSAPACTPVIKNEAGTAELANTTIYSHQTLKFKVTDPNSHTSTLSITKGGTAQTASTYLSSTTGVASGTVVTFTPTALSAGAADVTYVITQSCSGSGSDSVTITVKAEPTVYFKRGGKSAIQDGQDGDKSTQMTYSAAASTTAGGTDGHVVFALTDYSFGGTSATYWAIYNGTKNISYNTGITSSTSNKNLGQTGITTVDLSSSSNTITPNRTNDHYNIYYDLITGKFYIEYPLLVTYKYTLDNSTSTQKTTAYIPYNTTASTKDCSVTGYSPSSGNTWYNEVGCTSTFNFSTKLTADKTLYTPLSPIDYSLQISAGVKSTSNGSYSLDDTITGQLTMGGSAQTLQGTTGAKYQAKDVAYNSTCTIVAPNKSSTGYVFLGWYNGSSRVSADAEYSYTHTMGSSDTTLVARYERKYTLTINAGSNGKVNTNQTSISKTVYYSDVPGSFTIAPDTGYEFDSANSTNLADYYTVASNSATGKAAANITDANKVNKTITVAFKKRSYTVTGSQQYTADGTTLTPGNTGGTLTITHNTENKTTYEYGDTIKLTANAAAGNYLGGYYVQKIEVSTDGGTTWSTVTTAPLASAAVYSTSSMVCNSYTLNSTSVSSYQFRATFKAYYFLTIYNSWMDDGKGGFTYVAAPPTTVVAGSGNTARTYTYAAGTQAQRGEDNGPLNNGTATTTNIISTSTTYYEGNKLVVYAGETVALNYAGLATSEVVSGMFYNNARRYTTDKETDNLYYLREYKSGGWGDSVNGYDLGVAVGDTPDDDWDYDYAANTTVFVDEAYYSGDAAETIAANSEDYQTITANQETHTYSWTVTHSYLNIDLELASKYQVIINDGDHSGLSITNMNTEGYYFSGEDFNSAFKLTLTNTDDTCTYKFTSTTATVEAVEDGVDVSGITVTAKNSNNTNASTGAETSYFLVSGKMPATDVKITLPIIKTYKMRLANIVVADSTGNRKMLTECSGSSSSLTDCAATITAVPKKGSTTAEDISSSGALYTYHDNDNFDTATAYTSVTNNNYLKGGVNTTGSDVEDGYTITYTCTMNNNAVGPLYSFVGWYEGSYNGSGVFTVDYSKKLSGKSSFTYTPKKNTVVIAVGTRDVFLGGNFDKDGAYTTNSANKTWGSNRIQMNYDPTYVKPNGNETTERGRYYYSFESVSANVEYQFRAYDKKSSTNNSSTADLTIWKTWSGSDYAQNNNDILFGRHAYAEADGESHGQFVYKTNTNNWTLTDNGDATNRSSTKNHQANGYGAPVTVYFYAYDGGITVESTYQWSMAYVSEGRGIDAQSLVYSKSGSADMTYTVAEAFAGITPPSGYTYNHTNFNTPIASVANKTVNNNDVAITTRNSGYYGTEKIYECQVKEKDGSIVVTANPQDNNVDLQGFVVYNIETKKSEAVKTFTTDTSGSYTTYTANIKIPRESKVYVCPVYKFTSSYCASNDLESHTVYVRTDEIDKDVWGGLVAMYSWGHVKGMDSGAWPGQLLLPSDDGDTFYGELTFKINGLDGITFNNYDAIDGNHTRFVGTYVSKGVSDIAYSGNTTHTYQTYDFREPISIIENMKSTTSVTVGGKTIKPYDAESVDLTFALKSGDVSAAPTVESAGSGAYNRVSNSNWSNVGYLTDRGGNKVDLNGVKTNSTETYRIVAYYTNQYNSAGQYDFHDGDGETYARDGRNMKATYAINWAVYDTGGHSILAGSGNLSAVYTDMVYVEEDEEFITYIKSKLMASDHPVDGKAVKIAYEKPGEWSTAIRYSGQWYFDNVNTLLSANVRVGIYADEKYLPTNSNSKGYGTATIALTSGNSFTVDGEGLTPEFSQGNSKVAITKTHANSNFISINATNTNGKFIGWYIMNDDGEYEPINSNYQNTTLVPSFNDDITYYAFYQAAASYVFKYPGRNSDLSDQDTWVEFSAGGTDLDDDEMENGILKISERSTEAANALAKVGTDLKVFNKNINFNLSAADNSTPYCLYYTASSAAEQTYTLSVYAYNSSGSLVPFGSPGSVTGTYNTGIDVMTNASLGNGTNPLQYKPSGAGDYCEFIGWVEYNGSAPSVSDPILSTKRNFGYSITKNLSIAPLFGTAAQKETALSSASPTWAAGIDDVVITRELTSATTGKFYQDSLISFRYSSDTNQQLPLDTGKECGVIILVQKKTATDAQKTSFTGITDSKMQGYLTTLKTKDKTSGKLNNTTYGDAYALYIKAGSVSRLNRVDIYQAFDYADYDGGNFKVMSYYYDGTSYIYSDSVPGIYTVTP